MSRIEEAKLLDQTIERPSDFDLAEYWKSSTKKFQDGWQKCFATLRLDPRAAGWVKMWHVGSSNQTVAAPDAEGWITLSVQFDHEDEARFVVLGLGSRVEVVEPSSLRERVAAELGKLIARGRNAEKAAAPKPETEN